MLAFFGANWPRRGLLVALMTAFAIFNALSAVAIQLEWLVLARFLDGLPHGAYFGVARWWPPAWRRPAARDARSPR